MKFTWDPGKAALNLKDHSVTFAEALTVFGDPLARIHDDPDHSEGESREIIVGHSSAGASCWYALRKEPTASGCFRPEK